MYWLILLRQLQASVNRLLFWALRGGGAGSFGVVTEVVYKIHKIDHQGFHNLNFGVRTEEISSGNYLAILSACKRFLKFWVTKSLTLDNSWTGGYWTSGGAFLYYSGAKSSAEQFQQEWQAETAQWPANEKRWAFDELSSYKSYNDMRKTNVFYSGEELMKGKIPSDITGQKQFYIGNRLISKSYLEDNIDNFVEVLYEITMIKPHFMFNYFIGGKVIENNQSMALNPAFRTAQFQINVFSAEAKNHLIKKFPTFASGYNHGAKDEVEWEQSFWGTNAARLRRLKQYFDPENRFNCYHCIGYISPNI